MIDFKKNMPELLTFIILAIGIQAAVDYFSDKRMAFIVIPIVCIIYVLLKWEASRHEIV